jgi:hypothetical protein
MSIAFHSIPSCFLFFHLFPPGIILSLYASQIKVNKNHEFHFVQKWSFLGMLNNLISFIHQKPQELTKATKGFTSIPPAGVGLSLPISNHKSQ